MKMSIEGSNVTPDLESSLTETFLSFIHIIAECIALLYTMHFGRFGTIWTLFALLNGMQVHRLAYMSFQKADLAASYNCRRVFSPSILGFKARWVFFEMKHQPCKKFAANKCLHASY